MYILAYFCGTDGAPEGGLTPTVDCARLEDNTQVLTATALSATVITGLYYYDYSTADKDYHYVGVVDGGATLLGLLRYAPFAGKGDSDIIASVSTDVSSILTKLNSQYYEFRDLRRKHPDWNPFKEKRREQGTD